MMSEAFDNNERSDEVVQPVRHAEFLRLYTKYQHRILSYIFVLVPNRTDAEDLLQDTAVLLWAKFDEFESGTDFAA